MFRGGCRRPPIAALPLLALLAGDPAAAGEARTHDGFFLRLSAGGGGARTTLEDATDLSGIRLGDLELSGETGDINLAVGATVAPNLILHGTIWGWLIEGPDVSLGYFSDTWGDVNLDMTAFGVGLTYYFMPVNIYVSPSIGGAKLSIDTGNVTVDTDTGFAFDFTAGKEWWVGDGWGLGVAGGFSYHDIPDGGVDRNWKGPGFGIRFSATMN